MNRAVFLDRDGVLNEPVVRDGKPHPPSGPNELVVSADAPAALDDLRRLGFMLVCVTNQPDVARGTLSPQKLDAINGRLLAALPLDALYDCRHDDADACDCRKPNPGLIYQAARELDIDPAASYLIGDRWRDIEAGAAARCRTILVDRGYRERSSSVPPDVRVASLSAAAAWIAADVRGRA
jgi:D-glycero-D-manno-heptose 1,7-bisphosphate phosphatase